ncbi:MAG: bifunctional diaminohydroxyphosphoribosylaminopyrimidine deaminase/5-amino-6-(5-phosphoribosylamino)uracil reductase RibD [Candidatus Cloacimonetes bacterium]|nr:bifunctional diaminohydroxyphosphoribosylaminopyrimidine deaminase/5-amino-6-(5-phosphoribosylamino)uracil reductase RibD [Candidatus Cloacimonadota bacterium]
MPYDERFMRRAVELAENARGSVSPNPHVGAVLVREGRVIGEGGTQPPGGDHAEIVALKSADDAHGASMYVTLEPCCVHGRTPPCTEAIIAAGVSEVFAGIEDVNPQVRCSGFAALEAAGIRVQRDCLGAVIEQQLEAYITRVRHGRVFVVLKTAATLDGRLAAADGSSRWITSARARRDVHRLRAASDAVLTGIGTALADDPLLTARDIEGATQPLRVVLDGQLRIPIDSQLVRSVEVAPLLVVTCMEEGDKVEALRRAGAEALTGAPRDAAARLPHVLKALYERGVCQVMVEAGPRLNTAFLRAGLVDRWVVYVAPKLLGDGAGVVGGLGIGTMADARRFVLEDVARVGEDVRLEMLPVTQ